MSFAQRGMYLELLLEQWESGVVPDDPDACASLLGGKPSQWRSNWNVLRSKFDVSRSGFIRNRRLETERVKQLKWRKKAQKGGINSSKKRNSSTNAQLPSNQASTNTQHCVYDRFCDLDRDLDRSAWAAPLPPAQPEPIWKANGGARGARLVGNHRGCFQGPGGSVACARGLCIPAWLGQQWQQQYGDDRARADEGISAFIYRTVSELPPGPVGDVPKKFWPDAWQAHHGTRSPRTPIPSRTGDSMDAAKVGLRRRLERMAAAEEGGIGDGTHSLKG